MTGFASIEWSWLVIAAVFLGVLMVFEGIRQTISRTESRAEARNRRMRMIAQGATTEDLLRLLKPKKEGWRHTSLPLVGTLPSDLRQAGMTMTPAMFLTLVSGATLVIVMAASTVTPSPLVLGPLAMLSFLLPFVILRKRRKERMDKLVHQLPDALDLMARGLRVGHPINATINAVATDMKDPIASEFGLIVDQVSYGDELIDAFADFSDRIEIEDVRYLAVSVAIQHGTGGNLAQVLTTLAKVIRDRLAMRRKIKAISAEGRTTALFLSCLPLIIVGVTSFTAPGYYRDVATDPLFRPFAIIVIGLVVANFFAMRKLVNFHI